MCCVTYSAGSNSCIWPPLQIRCQTRFPVVVWVFFFSFCKPTCQKSYFSSIGRQLLAQEQSCSGFLQVNSGANTVPSPFFLLRCRCCSLSALGARGHVLLGRTPPPPWRASVPTAPVAWQSSFLHAATRLWRRWGRGWANVFQHFFLGIYYGAVAFLQSGLLLLQLLMQAPDGAQQQKPSVHS